MDAGTIFAIITFGCWWVFIIFWAVMARGNKRSVRQEKRGERLAYIVPMWVGMVLIAVNATPWGKEHLPAIALLPRGLGYAAAGAAVSVAGVALAIWARLTLGRNWAVEVTVKEDHALVTNGPYRLVRHPIYTAVLLLVLGLFLLVETVWALVGALLVIASCWIKLRQEERLMLGQFPEAYPAYMAHTKRLLPFIV